MGFDSLRIMVFYYFFFDYFREEIDKLPGKKINIFLLNFVKILNSKC